MLARRTLSAFAVLFAASLVSPPVLAKCGKDCKRTITSEFKSCKSSCAKGSAGRECKKTCRDEKKADLTTCRKATSPTPPLCGETTSTTTLHTSTTVHTVTSTTVHLPTTTVHVTTTTVHLTTTT